MFDRFAQNPTKQGLLPLEQHACLSVAPMMDWTDRHCRFLHRQISRRALLYTEMVTAAALIRGDAARLLRHDPREHPLALQLGGSEPRALAAAARIGAAAGFEEINLNVGCPSDRVKSGCFGAVLMRSPERVAECVAAMGAAAPGAEITVKCRIGVDEQDPRVALPALLEAIAAAGVRRVIIHARKAWLKGLSPKENRDVPPLDYGLVGEMIAAFPALSIHLNGGVADFAAVRDRLAEGVDGVMVGRAAYHDPMGILGPADTLWGLPPCPGPRQVVEAMIPYLTDHVAEGGRAHAVTRHMLGLFTGQPGARAWRRHLSMMATAPEAGPEILEAGLALVGAQRRAAAG